VKIDQLVPVLAEYDAISNHVLQLRRALRDAGYRSEIYADWIDPRLEAAGARPYSQCPASPDPDRVLLYHQSTHSPIAAWLIELAQAGQLIALDYHNITPSRYFARWDPQAAKSMEVARQELTSLAPYTGLAIADSRYNESELIRLGYAATAVCPLLVDLQEYHRDSGRPTLARVHPKRRRDRRRWLFVGRVAPNKCQHDVIAAFAVYRRLFDPRAVLTLVGGATSPRYLQALQRLADQLELGRSIEWRHSTPFSQLLAYFRAADVFVCLSEHEGFCVPLLEAMALELPVIAYRAAAVPDTVAGAGVLLDDKDPLAVACSVDELLSDEHRRAELVGAGRTRAEDFSLERTSTHFLDIVGAWLATVPAGA
jgi:glycosyltransferase involved in cell wall biosynthesis